ncbi:MAG TPA: hypothetical protein VNL69_04105 [Bacteroidota bacterium]|nr:hypothetical protein [Bacteroidota bacterium]
MIEKTQWRIKKTWGASNVNGGTRVMPPLMVRGTYRVIPIEMGT